MNSSNLYSPSHPPPQLLRSHPAGDPPLDRKPQPGDHAAPFLYDTHQPHTVNHHVSGVTGIGDQATSAPAPRRSLARTECPSSSNISSSSRSSSTDMANVALSFCRPFVPPQGRQEREKRKWLGGSANDAHPVSVLFVCFPILHLF